MIDLYLCILDITTKFMLGFTTPRKITVSELVTHDTDCPDITFLCVYVGDYGLWGHVNGGADIVAIPGMLRGSFYHTKICDFELTATEEDVGGFEVTVNVPAGEEVLVTGVELCEKGYKLIL
jgi:hypothetical protein